MENFAQKGNQDINFEFISALSWNSRAEEGWQTTRHMKSKTELIRNPLLSFLAARLSGLKTWSALN